MTPFLVLRTVVLVVAAATLHAVIASDLYAEQPAAGDEFFEREVRPLLAEKCFSCHGRGQAKGQLSLDSQAGVMAGGESGGAVTPGKPEDSLLIEAVRYEGGMEMPPDGKLADREIAVLTQWVLQGAAWPDDAATSGTAIRSEEGISDRDRQFWSFRAIRQPPLPSVTRGDWPRQPLDYFILNRLEAEGLQPVEEADRRTYIRRASLDLRGLPPSEAETAAFIGDVRPDAYEQLIERLLNSPQYGERWARHWLDVARYGEDQAHTFQARLYPNGYRFRDWVVDALNRDLRIDQFLLEQIAGDLLPREDHERQRNLPALGFFALGPVYYADAGCAPKAKADEHDDRIDTLTRGILGLTVACARCHDHKFDAIPTEDYYALAGVFASTEYVEAPLATPQVVRAYEDAQAAIERAEQEYKEAESEAADQSQQALAALKKVIEERKAAAPSKYLFAHSLKDGEPTNSKVHIRGNVAELGDEVPRRFLKVLSASDSLPFTQGSGRLELAQAIISPDNPLTARVFVNRVWQHHFGRGIVGSPSNFGLLGERPTHPELLDHLAAQFIASGWSLKQLHRDIMLSTTYRLASTGSAANQQRDAENRLLWRMNRRRLDIESWRDAALSVAGTLDPTFGGPSIDLSDQGNRRRTLYAAVSRHDLNPVLRLFDFPDPSLTSARRSLTTVPMQQLFVLNSQFMIDQSRALAARVEHEKPADDEARVDRFYRLVFGRPAREHELQLALDYIHRDMSADVSATEVKLSRLEQYAQALLSTNEFLFVD